MHEGADCVAARGVQAGFVNERRPQTLDSHAADKVDFNLASTPLGIATRC